MNRVELNPSTLKAASKVFRAISHPLRLRVVQALQRGRLSVGELTDRLGVEQAVVSKHLAVLKRAGVLECEADANYRYYSLANPGLLDLLNCIKNHCKGGH
jgi:ArsR family transcriptional regulator